MWPPARIGTKHFADKTEENQELFSENENKYIASVVSQFLRAIEIILSQDSKSHTQFIQGGRV